MKERKKALSLDNPTPELGLRLNLKLSSSLAHTLSQSSCRNTWRKSTQNSQLNCCVQESLNFDASNSPLNGVGGCGKPNLSGGDLANGIPRNWFTVAVAAGRDVVVPTTRPSAIRTVGLWWRDAPAVAATINRYKCIVRSLWLWAMLIPKEEGIHRP
jgi:hypothetical protein